MPSTNLIIYAVLIGAGLHSVWRGVRGLRGRGTGYGLLTGALVGRLAPEEREQTDRQALKATSIVRLIMGLVVTGLGVLFLVIGLTR